MASEPPQFIVAGVQKGGTTSLYHSLQAHPAVRLSRVKEHHFFDEHYQRGMAWYRGQFPALQSGEITGDLTPLYLFHPLARQRMARHCPAARLIVLLRDPVERAWSHYHHEVRLGFESRPFEQAIAAEPATLARAHARLNGDPTDAGHDLKHYSYLARGHYADQLERLFRLVPREQVQIIPSAALFAEPGHWLPRVHAFLGLAPRTDASLPSANEHTYPALEGGLRAWLRAYYRPHDERLAALLGRRFDWMEDAG